MTDDRMGEPAFDDPAHLEVRDLLASAKYDAPVPADVVARLDATLAELTGQAPAEDLDETSVVPLRRGSRLAPRLLAAAAVLVVAGGGAVGLNQVIGHSSGADDKAGSSVAADTAGGKSLTEAPPTPPAAVPQAPADGVGTEGFSATAGIPVLTTADFGADAVNLDLKALDKLQKAAQLRDTTALGTNDTAKSPSPVTSEKGEPLSGWRATAGAARACAGPKIDGTRSLPIILDGKPAVLVVHPARARLHLVQAWSCEGSTVLASATIPD